MEKVCRELHFFERVTPTVKSINRKNDTLIYYYRLKQDFDSLKEFYKKHLPQQGWILKSEHSEIWEEQIEFEKGQFWIRISYLKLNEQNYATVCKDSTLTR